MSRTLRAVFENGVFRPLEPTSYHEQERVLLTVHSETAAGENLIDDEYIAYCAKQADPCVSLETVRNALAKIPGSLVVDLRAERDEV